MQPVLRLYEDTLSSGSEARLPAFPRVVFVVHGALRIGDRDMDGGDAWHGEETVVLRADKTGATCWRWEVPAGRATAPRAVTACVRVRNSPPRSPYLPA